MQYSLRDRFRGAFLGVAIGEMVGLNPSIYTKPTRSKAQPIISCSGENQYPFATSDPIAEYDPIAQTGWGKLMLQQVQDLVQPLTEAEGSEPEGRANTVASKTESFKFSSDQQTNQPSAVPMQASLAVTTLPIALFHHDHLRRLPSLIEQSVIHQQQPPHLATGAIVIGYTLALALQEKLAASTLIPRLLTDLDLPDRDSLLTQQLQHVQRCLEQRCGLATIKNLFPTSPNPAIDPTPIAIALYGFLSTPNHVRLSLLRSAHLDFYPQVICCLVGALSGAYNSVAGIPFDWQIGLNGAGRNAIADLENPPSAAKRVIEQADRLFAIWSGVYQPDQSQATPDLVTALPDLIRPRPDLPHYFQ